MHKTYFLSYNFLSLSYLVDMIGIKPVPSDHKSNFKKLSAIPCGCNIKWTVHGMVPSRLNLNWAIVVYLLNLKIFKHPISFKTPKTRNMLVLSSAYHILKVQFLITNKYKIINLRPNLKKRTYILQSLHNTKVTF